MKNSIKKISLMLAALTLSSAMASAVSAADIFLSEPNKNNETEVTETAKPASNKGAFVWSDEDSSSSSKIVKKPTYTYKDKDTGAVKPNKVHKYPAYNVIPGGKYYSAAEAKAELEKYFGDHSEDIYMTRGESRSFCSGMYFYSDDPSVVTYNYATDKLEAHDYGSASVYVYTSGGIPFFRIDVSVGRNYSSKNPVTLDVVPEHQNIQKGDKITFTVTASDGKTYDDIVLSIKSGRNYATLVSKTGVLTADANGAVVVHAESKSKPSVYGDCLVYIGEYKSAVSAGYWFNCDGGIRVDKWFGSVCGNTICKPNGWIKCTDGIMIPVLQLIEAPVVQPDGTVEDKTILTTGAVSIFDKVFGDIVIGGTHPVVKPDCKPVIKPVVDCDYCKYGILCDHYKYDWHDWYGWYDWDWDDFDFRNFALSMIIRDYINK